MDSEIKEYEIVSGRPSDRKVNVEEIAKIAQRAENEWLSRMKDPKELSDHIVRILDHSLERIVAGALGFDDHWGRWEIQTCNGREPAIAKAVKAQCEATAKEIVTAALQNYKPKADLVKLVQKEYELALKDSIREAAVLLAVDDAQKLVSDALNAPITKLQKAFEEIRNPK